MLCEAIWQHVDSELLKLFRSDIMMAAMAWMHWGNVWRFKIAKIVSFGYPVWQHRGNIKIQI